MIESVTSKGRQLQRDSSAADIEREFQELSGSAKNCCVNEGQLLDALNLFADACQNYIHWLRAAEEKITKGKLPSGDKNELQKKCELLETLTEEKAVGRGLLDQVVKRGNAAYNCLLSEEPDDANLVNLEIDTRTKEYDEFLSSCENLKQLIEEGLRLRDVYQMQHAKCCEWMNETEPRVEAYDILYPDISSKRKALEEFQQLLQIVFEWQSEFDLLNTEAQKLLDMYSDSTVSSRVAQASTRYTNFVSKAKDVLHNLELHFQEHQQQQCTYSECLEVIDRSKEKLEDLKTPILSQEGAERHLAALKTLASNLEHNSNRAAYLEELTDKVIKSTSSDGAPQLKGDSEDVKKDLALLANDVASKLKEVQALLEEYNDFTNEYRKLEHYLDDLKLEEIPERSLLTDKKFLCERYKYIRNDLDNFYGLISKLKDKKDIKFAEKAEMLVKKYDCVQQTVQDRLKSLEWDVKTMEEYLIAAAACSEWIADMLDKVNRCRDISGSHHIVQERRDILRQARTVIPQGEKLVTDCSYLWDHLKPTWVAEVEESVTGQLRQMEEDYDSLKSLLNAAEDELDRCLEAWISFTSLYGSLTKWIKSYENAVNAALPAIDDKNSNWMIVETSLEKLLSEANNKKPEIENLNQLCEDLVEPTVSIREQVVSMSSKYTTLVGLLQDALNKVQRHRIQQNEFKVACEKYQRWVTTAQATFTSSNDLILDNLEERLDMLQSLNSTLPQGRSLLDYVVEAATRLLLAADDASVRREVDSMQEDMYRFSSSLNETIAKLLSLSKRWQDTLHKKDEIAEFVNSSLQKLNAPLPNQDIVQIRNSIDDCKTTLVSVEHQSLKLEELFSEIFEMSIESERATVVSELEGLRESINSVHGRTQSFLESLENDLAALQAYQRLLQETEKWLLQMNMHIMAQHALQIVNCQQAEQELKKYQDLLNQIRAYESNIIDLELSGQKLIDLYSTNASNTARNVTQQCGNVRQSYSSIFGAATAIQSRLENALEKFRIYEKTILYCENLLTEMEPFAAQTQDMPKTSEGLKIALNAKRGQLGQLTAAREDLQGAIQSCLDAVSSVSRPSSPEVSQVFHLPEQELSVKIRLQDLIEQIEQQISDLNKLLLNMEGISRRLEEAQKFLAEQSDCLEVIANSKAPYDQATIHGTIIRLEGIASDLSAEKLSLKNYINQTGIPNMVDMSEEFDLLQKKLDEKLKHQQLSLSRVEQLASLIHEIGEKLNDVDQALVFADKPSKGTVDQRQQALQAIIAECDNVDNKISSARSKLGDLKSDLESESSQQLHNQLNEATRKCDERRKRILRRVKSLDFIQNNFDTLLSDVQQATIWADEQLSVASREAGRSGFSSKQIAASMQDAKVRASEIKNASLTIPGLEERYANLSEELDTFDSQKLHVLLDDLRGKFNTLTDVANTKAEELGVILLKSQDFERVLELCRHWVNDQRAQRVERESSAEEQLHSYRAKMCLLKSFEDASLNDMLRKANVMEAHCDEKVKSELKHEVNCVVEDFNKFKDELSQKIAFFTSLSETERAYNELLDTCQHLLEETEKSASIEPMTDAATSVLEEQIQSFNRLQNVTGRLSEDISKLKALRDEFRQKTKLKHAEKVESFEAQNSRIKSEISEKLKLLKESLENQMQLKARLKELIARLDDLTRQYAQLSGPVGGTVSDAKTAVLAAQNLQDEVHDLENEINKVTVNRFLREGVSSLSNEVSQLNCNVERLLLKVRNSVLLREAFYRIIETVKEIVFKVESSLARNSQAQIPLTEQIPLYTHLLSELGEAEGQLQVAQDKHDTMAPDTVVDDHTVNQETLFDLKGKIGRLRKHIQTTQAKYEGTLREQEKLLAEFEKILDALQEDEVSVKRRPMLEYCGSDADNYLDTQMKLEESVSADLQKAVVIKNNVVACAVNGDTRFEEKLSELSRFEVALPRELRDRRRYLEEAKIMRQDMESYLEPVRLWSEKAKNILSLSVDYDNLDNVTTDMKTLLSESEEHLRGLKACQNLLPKLRGTMPEVAAIKLDKDILNATQEFSDLTVSLQNKLDELLEDMNLINNLKKLLQKAKVLISKVRLSEAWPDSIPAIHLRLKELKKASQDMQSNQGLIDEFNALSAVLEQRAHVDARELISEHVQQVNTQWERLLCDIARQLEVLDTSLHNWELYVKAHSAADLELTRAEADFKQAKAISCELPEAENLIQALGEKLLELRDAVKASEELSRPVVGYLNDRVAAVAVDSSRDQPTSVEKQVFALYDRLKWLETNVGEQLAFAKEEKEVFDQLTARINHLSEKLKAMNEEIKNIDIMSDDDNLEHVIKQMKQDVQDLSKEVKDMAESTQRRYLSRQMSIPDVIGHALSSIEVLSESVVASIGEQERIYEQARKCKKDYGDSVRTVVDWLEKAQQVLQDKESNIEDTEKKLVVLSNEVPDIRQTRHVGVMRNGQQITEWIKDAEEKATILATISSLGEKLSEVDNWIQERLLQVKNAHHLRERFLSLHQSLQSWIEYNDAFLNDKEPLVSLDVTKRRTAKAKELKHEIPQSQSYLSEMGALISKIGDVCDIADLLAILDTDEEQQATTESHLVEEVTLLNEMIEEWEQCDRKIKEITDWLTKSFTRLDSSSDHPDRTKNLREQLNMREKILKDVATQRTRLAMAVEKLMVHFKERTYSAHENQMMLRVGQTSTELARLQENVDQQCQTLSVCLSQEEQYQQDLQKLRQLLAMSERQLKIACSPAVSLQEKQEQLRLQQIFQEQIICYKSQIGELNERLRKLQTHHLPDVEPFRVKIQALPKDVVASRPHLLSLMEIPEHRPYVRTPRASARPSREASPDRPRSASGVFPGSGGEPAALTAVAAFTPEALVQGIIQNPKLATRMLEDDEIVDIHVLVPSMSSPTGAGLPATPPVSESPIAHVPTWKRVDHQSSNENFCDGAKPKKRVDEPPFDNEPRKKVKSSSPETPSVTTAPASILLTTVDQIARARSCSGDHLPLGDQWHLVSSVPVEAGAVCTGNDSIGDAQARATANAAVSPVVVSPTDSASGAHTSADSSQVLRQCTEVYATEILSHSPPRDFSDDKV